MNIIYRIMALLSHLPDDDLVSRAGIYQRSKLGLRNFFQLFSIQGAVTRRVNVHVTVGCLLLTGDGGHKEGPDMRETLNH